MDSAPVGGHVKDTCTWHEGSAGACIVFIVKQQKMQMYILQNESIQLVCYAWEKVQIVNDSEMSVSRGTESYK